MKYTIVYKKIGKLCQTCPATKCFSATRPAKIQLVDGIPIEKCFAQGLTIKQRTSVISITLSWIFLFHVTCSVFMNLILQNTTVAVLLH